MTGWQGGDWETLPYLVLPWRSAAVAFVQRVGLYF